MVVGSGPNGLAAAITLAEAGRSVLALEASGTPGGGLRTQELLELGFRHDVCSTVMAFPPFLSVFGHLDYAVPTAPLAHPFDDGTAVLAEASSRLTAMSLGQDGDAYLRLVQPLERRFTELLETALAPIGVPRHPLLLARFGLPGLLPATSLARAWFRTRDARALLAGAAAHSQLALGEPGTAAVALLMLASAHAGGWGFARGGSASVAEAMVRRMEELGGEVRCRERVTDLARLPPHRAVLLDLAPKRVLELGATALPQHYRHALSKFRHGPGAFKVDWTLDAPIPWRAADCSRAGTVHIGGTMEEIAESEQMVARGRHPSRPFVLLTQPTLFDHTRAPEGKHVAWAYCHVPNGSDQDMTKAIEDQVERFAPGFCDVVRKRSAWTTQRLESEEPNCIGGDVMGGRMDLWGLVARPVLSFNPYATPNPEIFLCSASTPPGGGIHGMCGVNAARAALRSRLR